MAIPTYAPTNGSPRGRPRRADNAMSGADGRVRVVDFGLARIDAASGSRDVPRASSVRLTVAGVVYSLLNASVFIGWAVSSWPRRAKPGVVASNPQMLSRG